MASDLPRLIAELARALPAPAPTSDTVQIMISVDDLKELGPSMTGSPEAIL